MMRDGIRVEVMAVKANVPAAPKPMTSPPKRESYNVTDYKEGYKTWFADGYREGLKINTPGQKNEV